MKPLLSIITINLNNITGLQKTIESVVHQNNGNFEFIIIDGGSTDGSIEIIQNYSHKIKYWISEPDNGVYDAMNKGIRKSNSEYCLFINSGDILYNNNVLTDIVNLNLKADIINGNAFVGTRDRGLQHVKPPDRISFYTFFHHTILHQATLIRTSLFKDIGLYNDKLRIVADWEFFVKALFCHNCSYLAINVTISVFDNTGISSQPENFHISKSERQELLKKYFPYFVDDYQLFRPHSTFTFLQNIQKSKFLLSIFTLLSRLINKLFVLFPR